MDEHTFKTIVSGKECDIVIKTGLTWGEVQELLKKSVTMGEAGAKDFNFNNFCDILLQKTIVSGLPFDKGDFTALKNMDMAEMSVILGEILKVIPLETYFKNLGMDSVPFLNQSEA
jgi:hypothetical protein